MFPLFAALVASAEPAGFAPRVDTTSECTLHSFKEITQDPVGAAGERFCAEVYALKRERIVEILEKPGGSSADDLTVAATIKTRSLLTNLSDEPRRYYIEGIAHPQLPCFVKGGGACVPFLHPVTIDLIKAESR
jgi:hypothetical protein